MTRTALFRVVLDIVVLKGVAAWENPVETL